MANPFFLPAAAIFGIVGYLTYTKTKRVNSGLTTPETANEVQVVRQYADNDDNWSCPLTVVSNYDYSPVIKEEPGQFGVPRRILRGPGDSEIITQGDYYHAL